MSKFQQKAEAQTKQIIGQMLGDQLLVEEAREQQRRATEPESTAGRQDRDRHHDDRHDQGIVRDERGQEQPRDKERAQRVSRVDRGGDPPGKGKEGGGCCPAARTVGRVTVDTNELRRQQKRRPVSRLSVKSGMHSRRSAA